MKAYELVDTPEKWWGGREDGFKQNCAWTAITSVYDGAAQINAQLKIMKRLGLKDLFGIWKWNDDSDQPTVYGIMKELDV
jgi:hypothetical protein